MEHESLETGASPSAPQKPPRSKAERAIVWTFIGLLIVLTGIEALAKTGYEKTITNLQAAIDEGTGPLTLDDFNKKLKTGLPIQGTGDHEGRATVLYTWPSLVKKYQLHLEVAADGTEMLRTFATGNDPAEFIRYRSPDSETEGSEEEMEGQFEGDGEEGESGRRRPRRPDGERGEGNPEERLESTE